MAAILGVDPWRSAYDVWLEKTGQLPGVEENESMRAGTLFERGVLRFAAQELGPLVRNQRRTLGEWRLAANIDAIVKASGEPVEAKTAGLFGPIRDEWGEPGSDEVPERVIIQCHVQLLCVQMKVCHVAAFLGGRGFVRYRIEWDGDLGNAILDAASDFWHNRVIPCVPPEGLPNLENVKALKRAEGKRVEIAPDLVRGWRQLKAIASGVKTALDETEAEILVQMGDAQIGECPGIGEVRMTPVKGSEYTVKRKDGVRMDWKPAKQTKEIEGSCPKPPSLEASTA